MFTICFLSGLRGKALRRRLWYKALDGLERSLYNLTCIVVDRVKNPVLGRQILGLVLKLRDALKGEFVRLVESLGVKRAWEASKFAVDWGNRGARVWRDDVSFAKLHAVVALYSPSGWGS
ncbi:hypothetical protein KA005_24365 [bacterium]|nr:hypothetical protein [bacterium]